MLVAPQSFEMFPIHNGFATMLEYFESFAFFNPINKQITISTIIM